VSGRVIEGEGGEIHSSPKAGEATGQRKGQTRWHGEWELFLGWRIIDKD
jgi:hypothetical protein